MLYSSHLGANEHIPRHTMTRQGSLVPLFATKVLYMLAKRFWRMQNHWAADRPGEAQAYFDYFIM
jgi:hypothetical protein